MKCGREVEVVVKHLEVHLERLCRLAMSSLPILQTWLIESGKTISTHQKSQHSLSCSPIELVKRFFIFQQTILSEFIGSFNNCFDLYVNILYSLLYSRIREARKR